MTSLAVAAEPVRGRQGRTRWGAVEGGQVSSRAVRPAEGSLNGCRGSDTIPTDWELRRRIAIFLPALGGLVSGVGLGREYRSVYGCEADTHDWEAQAVMLSQVS